MNSLNAFLARWAAGPVIKGTRIEPDFLLVEAELGRSREQTHEDFPTLPVGVIHAAAQERSVA